MFNYIQSCIFINTEWCLVRIKNSPPFTYMSCSLSVKNRVSFCFPNKLYTVPFPVNAHYPHFKQLRLCYVKMIHSFTKVNSLNIISMKFSTKMTTYYRLKNLNKFVEKNWKLLWFRVYRDNIWSKAKRECLNYPKTHVIMMLLCQLSHSDQANIKQFSIISETIFNL